MVAYDVQSSCITCSDAGLGCSTIPVVAGRSLRSPFAELEGKRFFMCQIHAFVRQEGLFLMPLPLPSVNFHPQLPCGSFGRGFSAYSNKGIMKLRKENRKKWESTLESNWQERYYGVPYDYLATLYDKRKEHLKTHRSEPFPTAMWHPCSPLPEGLAESLDIYYSKRERLPFIPTAWVKSDFLGQDDILDRAGLNWTHYVPTIRLSEEEEESLESLPLSDPKKKKKKATSKAQIESEDESNGEGNKADAKGGNIPEDIAIEVDVDVEMADNAGVETVDDEVPEPIVPPKRTRHATRKMELVANEHRMNLSFFYRNSSR